MFGIADMSNGSASLSWVIGKQVLNISCFKTSCSVRIVGVAHIIYIVNGLFFDTGRFLDKLFIDLSRKVLPRNGPFSGPFLDKIYLIQYNKVIKLLFCGL